MTLNKFWTLSELSVHDKIAAWNLFKTHSYILECHLNSKPIGWCWHLSCDFVMNWQFRKSSKFSQSHYEWFLNSYLMLLSSLPQVCSWDNCILFKDISNADLNRFWMYLKTEIVVGKEWLQVIIQNSLKSDLKKDLNRSHKSGIIRWIVSMEFEWNIKHLNCLKKILKEFCMIFKLNLNSNGIWMNKGSIMNGIRMIDA